MRLRKPLERFSRFGAPVLACSLVLAACGGGGSHKTAPDATTSTKPKVLAVQTSTLKIGRAIVESAGPPNVQIDTATGRAVLKASQTYIDSALFAPLNTGAIGGDYAGIFASGVRAAATTSDSHALTNVDVGKVQKFSTSATPVTMSAFAGTLGELVYVATNFSVTEKTTIAGSAATLTHVVELTFAQTGKTWLVTAYRVQTSRKTAAGTTTTTATGGTKP